jgi:hypothetical protein
MQIPPRSALAWLGAERLPGSNQDMILRVGRSALGAIFVKSRVQKLMALGAFLAVNSTAPSRRGHPSCVIANRFAASSSNISAA